MDTTTQRPNLNPVSPENLQDPIALYRELRSTDPVHWSEAIQGWVLTRHDDVVAAFRDPRLSANRVKFFELQVQGLGPDVLKDFLSIIPHEMAMQDGPGHIRLRRNTHHGFSAQAVDTLQPTIRRILEKLLERVQARGEMDLAKELSHQLPPLVIAELMGVPADDRERFMQWAQGIADFCAPSPGADMLGIASRANASIREMRDYLVAIAEERRRAPGQDLLSRMVHAQEEGGMSVAELAANAVLILFAGHATTTDQISNGVHALLTHPEQLQKLRENPALLPSAVEEMLRLYSSLPSIFRIAAEDFELRGRSIRKGQVVHLFLAAANRDPEAFPDPDRFDIARESSQRSVSFGFGPHQCLGTALARREMELTFEMLLQRMPGLRLDERQPPRQRYSLAFRGFDSLPVRW